MRSRPRLVAVAVLAAVACVVAGVTLGSLLLSRHPAPWFPDLYTTPPPPAASPPAPGVYLPVPVIQQAYPLDCEAAALQAALAALNVDVTQQQIFDKLPHDTRPPVIGSDGFPAQWGNPYAAFVGDVQGQESNFTGYGVYYQPVAAVASGFGVHANGRLGWTVGDIEDQIRLGNPVEVWVDSEFRVRQPRYWRAWDGTQVPYIIGEHAVTVMGFDSHAGTITIVDVLRGRLHTFARDEFARVLTTFGGMGIAITK